MGLDDVDEPAVVGSAWSDDVDDVPPWGREDDVTITPRAVRQLHALDSGKVAAILDALRGRLHTGSTSIVEVTAQGQVFRCFVGRHRDGSRVLLGVVARRSAVA